VNRPAELIVKTAAVDAVTARDVDTAARIDDLITEAGAGMSSHQAVGWRDLRQKCAPPAVRSGILGSALGRQHFIRINVHR
jgi:hypothetical protein